MTTIFFRSNKDCSSIGGFSIGGFFRTRHSPSSVGFVAGPEKPPYRSSRLYYFHVQHHRQLPLQITFPRAPTPPPTRIGNQLEKHPYLVSYPDMAVENKSHAYMQPPRRLRRQHRGYNQQQLNDWLDEQERIIRARGLPDEIVEEFDPLYNPPNPADQFHQIYDRGEHVVEQGRRTILFRFNLNLENSIAQQIQNKIVEQVKTRFKLKLSTTVELRNIADGKKISFYQTIGTSPWLETLTASRNWVKQQEELRLENQRRPNTQWAYERPS